MRNAWIGSLCLLFVAQYCTRYRPYERPTIEKEMRFHQVDYDTEVRDSLARHPETTAFTCTDCGLTEIPEEVLACKNLTRLFLNDNKIKSIPEEISQLANLQSIDFSRNPGLGFPTELTLLPRLHSITLYQANIRALPNELSQLQHLRTLNIGQNPFLPDGLNVIGSIRKLNHINLSYCNFHEVPEALAGASQLTSLNLESNSIQELPDFLFDLPLVALSLDENKFYQLPEKFKRLKGTLEYISLGGNPIDNASIEELRKWLPECEVDFWRD